MINPVLALLLTGVVLTTLAVVLWPVRGLFWRWRRAGRASARVLIEDALKHVYDCEYHRYPCTLHSLSGALGLSGDRAAELLERLERLELVAPAEGAYRLTAAGRSDALRVIRIHRLWERYLSDETGLEPPEWHLHAEYQEHRLSPEEVEALAASMGDPRYDPHGDPIPTADGEIAPPRGRPLTELPPGELAEIVHVEDEPETIFAQLVAEGLRPGMRVRVSETSPQRIRFEADAEEHVLAPVVAANLAVMSLPEEKEMEGPFASLSSLRPGERGRVTRISTACRGPERRRLLDLGITPGTVVESELTSPGGDPTAYRIRGALIALRNEQSDQIHIDRLESPASP